MNRRGATVYMLVRDKQRGLDAIRRLEEVYYLKILCPHAFEYLIFKMGPLVNPPSICEVVGSGVFITTFLQRYCMYESMYTEDSDVNLPTSAPQQEVYPDENGT